MLNYNKAKSLYCQQYSMSEEHILLERWLKIMKRAYLQAETSWTASICNHNVQQLWYLIGIVHLWSKQEYIEIDRYNILFWDQTLNCMPDTYPKNIKTLYANSYMIQMNLLIFAPPKKLVSCLSTITPAFIFLHLTKLGSNDNSWENILSSHVIMLSFLI